MKKILLLGSGELGKEFTIAAKRAGQYVIGAGASLYCALGFGLPWYVCLLAAIAAGAVLGAISGLLKAYRNVNEVISCIMLNWISLYLVNALLSQVKETASPYTFTLSSTNPDAILPSLGLGARAVGAPRRRPNG